MSEQKLTVAEAIAQGYEYYGEDAQRFQRIRHLDGDIDEYTFSRGKLYLFDKTAQNYGVSPESIRDSISDLVYNEWVDETGDDDGDNVYDAVQNMDFSDVADRINAALAHKKYYVLTKIELVP